MESPGGSWAMSAPGSCQLPPGDSSFHQATPVSRQGQNRPAAQTLARALAAVFAAGSTPKRIRINTRWPRCATQACKPHLETRATETVPRDCPTIPTATP
eukprot:365328-Chlamydomonas_euryale.AAC.13